jgi:hypothetical protein
MKRKTVKTTAAVTATIGRTWDFRPTTRIHAEGKQVKGYNCRREKRNWTES